VRHERPARIARELDDRRQARRIDDRRAPRVQLTAQYAPGSSFLNEAFNSARFASCAVTPSEA